MPKYVIVLIALGGLAFIVLVLGVIYMIWDIFSTYSRMTEGMG